VSAAARSAVASYDSIRTQVLALPMAWQLNLIKDITNGELSSLYGVDDLSVGVERARAELLSWDERTETLDPYAVQNFRAMNGRASW
jgi:hypothetical protein